MKNNEGKNHHKKLNQGKTNRNWRLFIAMIISLCVSLFPFETSSNIVFAEENTRIVVKSQQMLAFHWRITNWSDRSSVCDIYVGHDEQPSSKEIEESCGKEILATWMTTPPCQAAMIGGDVNACQGVFIGYKGRDFHVVNETIELPAVKLSVAPVNCRPGSWCQERAFLRFIGEEPLAGHKITSIHVKIGSVEKKCDEAVCELRMPITETEGVQVEYWAISDYGDESEKASFLMRNIQDQENNQYRFDLMDAGLDENTPTAVSLWKLLPSIDTENSTVFESLESIDQLETNNKLLYLAGKLIVNGVVDGKSCSGFGLLENHSANPCGENLASDKVFEWQNKYNQEIFTAAEKYKIPGKVLKGIIAQETQFWPSRTLKEYGLGRITENGADMLLTWNLPIFLDECLSQYSSDYCSSGYSNLTAESQGFLRGVVLSDVGTDQEMDLLAATLYSSVYQVDQMVRNVTGLPVADISTYDDMWKITIANYHAGSGCVGTAMQTAWDNGNSMIWDDIYPNLLGDCMGAADYVESVLSLAK